MCHHPITPGWLPQLRTPLLIVDKLRLTWNVDSVTETAHAWECDRFYRMCCSHSAYIPDLTLLLDPACSHSIAQHYFAYSVLNPRCYQVAQKCSDAYDIPVSTHDYRMTLLRVPIIITLTLVRVPKNNHVKGFLGQFSFHRPSDLPGEDTAQVSFNLQLIVLTRLLSHHCLKR